MRKILIFSNSVLILCFILLIQGCGSFGKSSGNCNDGWTSPSIGKQGACSHHGGVKKSVDSPTEEQPTPTTMTSTQEQAN
jgi:hypothetical protein